jgi:hypothetical protein
MNTPLPRKDDTHYNTLALALYDTYALLEKAQYNLRHKASSLLMQDLMLDIEASLGRVYGASNLLHTAGHDLYTIASQIRDQRDEAMSEGDARYDQGWQDGVSYLLKHIAAQNTELLTRLLDILLKNGDQYPLLGQLVGMMASAIPPTVSPLTDDPA